LVERRIGIAVALSVSQRFTPARRRWIISLRKLAEIAKNRLFGNKISN